MRKAFTFLFSSIIILYGWLGYNLIRNQQLPSCQSSAKLSDIAEEVIAISLETHHNCKLKQIDLIKRDKEHIFLVSNQQLFHFHSSGKFLGVITPQGIVVTDYTIAPTHKCLIVIGTNKEVHYYDYDGQLLGKRFLPIEDSWQTFGQIAYHDNHLWATIDLVNKNLNQQTVLEQWLYKFDLNLRVVEKRKLEVADLGRININYSPNPKIKTYNGNIYVYATDPQQTHILNDTLYLINSKQLNITDNYSKILPIQIGSRFLITSSCDPIEQNYIFCYDQQQRKAYQIKNGLEDNYYMTGIISKLQPLDLNGQTYYYLKSNKETDDNPILYIIKMKV
ncbi:MAG: 6-bladed beta-propeller [Parabacteroides sp.]|nr:6-bladed beta-propeller [Parabacteroides sp.]